jgi:FK506-binding protein 1
VLHQKLIMNRNRDTMEVRRSTIFLVGLLSLLAGIVLTYIVYPYFTNTESNRAQQGDKVAILYSTKLANGTELESAKDREKPFELVLGKGMVFKGWDESIVGMTVGEKKTTTIPAAEAYGHGGIPDGKGGYVVPPDSSIILDVELLGIRR